jgi:hypothetical protein
MTTQERAREIAAAHVASELSTQLMNLSGVAVWEGWPDGAYQTSDDPVWHIVIPSDGSRIGGDRIVCVSRIDGRVVFDGVIGE